MGSRTDITKANNGLVITSLGLPTTVHATTLSSSVTSHATNLRTPTPNFRDCSHLITFRANKSTSKLMRKVARTYRLKPRVSALQTWVSATITDEDTCIEQGYEWVCEDDGEETNC
ncbi:hypothetical protein GOBAR_AA15291 [Gossypium barbadense]|uniref:Pectinesterase inhibitor domain-containing protein n=1 Tax=Gossypium barbadense TaxID=3634 RepID=A0A2P5XPV7_GOSBA|nr:hypothetical protein GOBAR_AA15291 [Gossypium barbadense]